VGLFCGRGDKLGADNFDEFPAVEGEVLPLWDIGIVAVDAVDHVLDVVGRSPVRKALENLPLLRPFGAGSPLNPQRHVANHIGRSIVGSGAEMTRELRSVTVALGPADIFEVAAIVTKTLSIGQANVCNDASGKNDDITVECVDVEDRLGELSSGVDELTCNDATENNPVGMLLAGDDTACDSFAGCSVGCVAVLNKLLNEVVS